MDEDKIWVDDRRADRISIMGPLQKDDRRFIIRQIGNGELYFDGQKTLLKQVSGKARLTETYTATKTKDTCKVKEIYDYGDVQVRLTEERKPLWLIVLKERSRECCWFLLHLERDTRREAIKIALVGYGHRWRIEEVHRQIKGDECTTMDCGFISV